MAEDNLDIHLSKEKDKKKFFLKKIRLTDFPDLKKIYKDFFNNSSNYLNGKYKNKYILIGKLHNKKEKDDLILKIKNKMFKNKKISVISKITTENNSYIEKKNFIDNKINKNSTLKLGQQYIDDIELDDLFNKFKTVHKINKSKTTNFITLKDIIEKKIKNNPSSNNIKIENNSGNNFQLHKSSENNIYNKTISTSFSNKKFKNDNLFDSNLRKSLLEIKKLNKDLHPFSKINSVNNIITQFNGNNNNKLENQKFSTMNNFFDINNKKKKNDKNIRKRNKMINKQIQFLSENKDSNNWICKTEKNYFAQILANQEKALLKSSKSQTLINNYGNKISMKLNKPKKDLLFLNIDKYRIIQELRNRIDVLNKKVGPEHYYNWIKDLRSISEENFNNKNKDNYNINKIRNPMKNDRKYNFFKNNFRLKNLKKIVNEINKDSQNYEGLLVKGQNLLKLEYEYVKSLKNKKIINNFEAFLPTIDLEDKNFANNKNFLK